MKTSFVPQTANLLRPADGQDRGGKAGKSGQSGSTMVQLPMQTLFAGEAFRPEMHKALSSTLGQGITANGMLSTLPLRLKTPLTRLDRGSCSASASCLVFSGWHSDSEEDPAPQSSFSSPTSLNNLHESGSTSTPKGSMGSLKISASSLNDESPTLGDFKEVSLPSALQDSMTSLCSSSPSIRSSSSSLRSGNSSENDSWETNSWSSGATCLLRSSIKQHSKEVFRDRAGSFNRQQPESDSETGSQKLENTQMSRRKAETQKRAQKVPMERKDSEQSQTSSQCSSLTSANASQVEKKIEAKLQFSKFLDEVSCRVLDPKSWHAFDVGPQKEDQSQPVYQVNRPAYSPVSSQQIFQANLWLSLPTRKSNASRSANKWKTCVPNCRLLDTDALIKKKDSVKEPGRLYLETDRDTAQTECLNSRRVHPREVREAQTIGVKPNPVQSNLKDGFRGVPYISTSLQKTRNSSVVSAIISKQGFIFSNRITA